MMTNDNDDLAALVSSLALARVLCVGDVMVDRFVHGEVERISPEGPVPVLRHGHVETAPGGAANVARNVGSLGAVCTLVSVVGDDTAARDLAVELRESTSLNVRFVVDPSRPTTLKTRFVSQGHQLLRVDDEVKTDVDDSVAAELLEYIRDELHQHDVMVLSDYAKGVLTPVVVVAAIEAARALGKAVIVDPKARDLSRYAGARLVTPNSAETTLISGIQPVSDEAAERAGQRILDTYRLDGVLITRGAGGMTLLDRDGSAVHVAAHTRDVFDVVGAGDTVVSMLATALAVGASASDAVRLSNVAAGVVVAKRGTSVVTRTELLDEIESAAAATSTPLAGSDAELEAIVERKRAHGARIGFTNGVFDIVHPGHLSLLEFAKEACDFLVVAINSDASVRRLKGPTRPINAECDRAAVVGGFGAVDAVVVFDDDTPLRLISLIRPDVLVKGADYAESEIVGGDVVRSYGGTILRAEIVGGKSSTRIIQQIAKEVK